MLGDIRKGEQALLTVLLFGVAPVLISLKQNQYFPNSLSSSTIFLSPAVLTPTEPVILLLSLFAEVLFFGALF
jgi:hypothetical protein